MLRLVYFLYGYGVGICLLCGCVAFVGFREFRRARQVIRGLLSYYFYKLWLDLLVFVNETLLF